MIVAAFRRWLRKRLLRLGRSMSHDALLGRGESLARATAARAAAESEAYRTLLLERGLDPADWKRAAPLLERLPVLTKESTFGRFTVQQLSRPVPPRDLADVLTSSGRGSSTFGFRLTTRRQHERAWFDIDLGLQDAFGVDDRPTLLVNCLPMGVTFQSRAVTVANVSVREDMACAILRDLGPRFEQTIVCTDPLFVRRLLSAAKEARLDWSALNTSLIMGEEVLVEAQRDYLAQRLGIDLDCNGVRTIASSFGVAELGLNLLFESRETIRIRRAMRRDPELAKRIMGNRPSTSMPSVFSYNPLRCHVEVIDPDADGFGELCFTVNDKDAVIRLPRYATGDCGKLVSTTELVEVAARTGIAVPWLPVVLLSGRLADRASHLPSAEDIKEALYADEFVADGLSGAFRLQARHDQIQLTLQASDAASAIDPARLQRLTELMRERTKAPLHVDVLSPEDFPWRPALDFERKFSYILR
jgi:phenylacetate-CoA ligase